MADRFFFINKKVIGFDDIHVVKGFQNSILFFEGSNKFDFFVSNGFYSIDISRIFLLTSIDY